MIKLEHTLQVNSTWHCSLIMIMMALMPFMLLVTVLFTCSWQSGCSSDVQIVGIVFHCHTTMSKLPAACVRGPTQHLTASSTHKKSCMHIWHVSSWNMAICVNIAARHGVLDLHSLCLLPPKQIQETDSELNLHICKSCHNVTYTTYDNGT